MRRSESTSDFSTLTRRLLPERRPIAALGLVLVVTMLLPLAGPLLIGRFIDDAIDGAATADLIRIAVAFLVVMVASDALKLLVAWRSVHVAWRVGNSLRTDLCRHALGLDLSWHAEHSAGQLIERVDGDVDALTRFSATAVLQLLGNLILFVGVVVVVVVIDWRAGLLTAVVGLVAMALLIRMRQLAVPHRDHEREVLGALYGDIEERLGGLEDLRANGASGWAMHRLHRYSAQWWRVARRAALWGDGGLAGANVVFAIGSAATLALGVSLQRSGVASIGTVFALFRYSQLISEPLWQVAEQLSEMQKAVAGTRRAARLLATESALVDGVGERPSSKALAIDFDHIWFGYGTGSWILHDIDVAIAPGTKVGVVGRTGSGKTSLGRLVLRLWDAEQGTVRVGGRDVRDYRRSELRHAVGVVTQEVDVFRANVRDNATLFGSVQAPDNEISKAIRSAGLGDWLDELANGLDSVIDGSNEMSAGESQLLAFARVLLRDPGVVILDEASSRLDPVTEAGIGPAIQKLLADRTALVIAHRLETLDYMDEIIVVDHGRIAEHGRRVDLLADPSSRYRELLDAGSAVTRGTAGAT